MKTKHTMLVVLLPAILLMAGCSSLYEKPPTAAEYKFFDISTNRIPVVTTDPVTQKPVTNIAEEYVMVPNATAQMTAQTVGNATGLGLPGWGALVTTVISGIFGIWGTSRSRKARVSAATLAQIIETGEQILLTAPNGTELAAQWKAWMIKHQAETGTIAEVSELVSTVVDTDEARKVAEQIAIFLQKNTASSK